MYPSEEVIMSQEPADELRTPEEWERTPQVTWVVYDRDGWNYCPPAGYEPKSWHEPITLAEYRARAAVSTIGPASP